MGPLFTSDYNVFSFPSPPMGRSWFQGNELLTRWDVSRCRWWARQDYIILHIESTVGTVWEYCVYREWDQRNCVRVCGVDRPPCVVPPSVTTLMVHLPLAVVIQSTDHWLCCILNCDTEGVWILVSTCVVLEWSWGLPNAVLQYDGLRLFVL